MNNDTQAYRMTTLGLTLQESLDEMIQSNNLKTEMAQKVIKEFDKSINKALSTRIKNKINFKSTKLDIYRNCDNVWTLVFNGMDLTFCDQSVSNIKLNNDTKVKIVACEGRSDKKNAKAPNPDE